MQTKPDQLSVLAFDDSLTDLEELSSTYPDLRYFQTHCPPGGSSDAICDAALRHLADEHPDVILLDLVWQDPGIAFTAMDFEGITFLQEASDRSLLVGVVLVIWSQYLALARPLLNRRLPALWAGGVRNIIIAEKPRIPPLESICARQ